MHKINTPFGKGADENNWMEGRWVCTSLWDEELAWGTLLDGFYAIFEKCRPKVSFLANFLRGGHTR